MPAELRKKTREALVVIESPYRGATPEEVERNKRYLRACLRDSLLRGEAPFASHAMYAATGALDDDVPIERELGMVAGFRWAEVADFVAVYVDLGISDGMSRGLEDHRSRGAVVIERSIPDWDQWGEE